MDLKTLTDEALETLRVDILTEQERRQALATIPDQIAELARKYVDGGGDPGNLPDTRSGEGSQEVALGG